MPDMEPIRPLFFNIHEHYKWAEIVTYVLGGVTALLFAWGLWRHVKKWRLGRAESVDWAWTDRLKALVQFAFFQGRLVSDRYALAMHLAIFFGMAVLFLGTALATLDQDVAYLLFDWQFLRGSFYLGYKLFLDLFAVALIVGLALAFYRRYVLKPERLGNLVYPTFPLDSFYLLAILLFIAVSGLLVEAIRLAASRVPWAHWSPVGNLLAGAFVSFSPGTLQSAHFLLWAAHGLAAMAFIALVPHSKAFHLVSSAASIFLRNLKAVGALPAAEPTGVTKINDFTWRQLLQFDACTWCGRCQEMCPAHTAGYSLSPKNVILKLDDHLLKTARANGQASAPVPTSEAPTATAPPSSLHDSVITAAELWACTTCRACEEVCPVFIEQPRAIIDLRRYLVSQGSMDKTVQDALNHLNRYGNSFGKSDRMRAKWTQGLEPKIKDARKEEVEYLWFLGDYASFDPRVQEITKTTAKIFQRAGLNFGLLYEGERNAGNDARRVGEEGLFEVLKEKNLQAIGQAKFKTLVTTDPHSLNTLKNEYQLAGNGVAVKHYTEVLDQMLAEGKLTLKKPLAGRVTYHDPCYLGRYNGVYDPPRRILQALGCQLVEMPRHRDRSFCCGAGGGRIWMEDTPGIKERPAENRIKEAAALPDVATFVVACPKDIAMFRDAVKTSGNEGKIQVKDIAELVWEALEPS